MPDKTFEHKIIRDTARHTGGTTHVHIHDQGVTITTPVRINPEPPWRDPFKDHFEFDNNGNPK